MKFSSLISLLLFLLLAVEARSDLMVHVDFVRDNHNGNGVAGANGTADWIEELDQATADAGVATFSAAERSVIQSNIISHLTTTYGGYSVNFTNVLPAVVHDTIYFGLEGVAGLLGNAPLDIGNLFTGQVTNVVPRSFSTFIETTDPRANMVSEISLALAGTAAHELGHSLGLLHHHAYSNAGITPANYAATGGLQNNHIMATGSTGLTEAGRETLRTFSPFERVMFDISGGARPVFTGQDNDSIVPGGGIVSDRTEDLGADAGGSIATARALSFTTGATSGLEISFVEADLDGLASDIDFYRFNASGAGRLLAHAYSTSLGYASTLEFNTTLQLFNSLGTLLASNDDVMYDGNVFNAGTVRSTDSFLNNIPIPAAGDYFLRVAATGGTGLAGSNYWLVTAFGLAIPEPSCFILTCLTVAVGLQLRSRRPL